MSQVTAIYTNWKRPRHLEQIIAACQSQTVATDIVLVDNAQPTNQIHPKGVTRYQHDNSLVCWQRWTYAVQATTPYLLVMDDDLIFRANDVLATCISYLESHPVVNIVGYTGVIYKGSYLLGKHFHSVTEPKAVDIVKGRFMFIRTSALAGLDMTPELTCDDIKVSAHIKGGKVLLPLSIADMPEGEEALFRQPGQQQRREAAGKKYLF